MEESNYYLINEPDIPTFLQYQKNINQLYESTIDLAFCSDNMFSKTTNWSIYDRESEDTGSYHEMIRFEILSDNTPTILCPTSPKYN